MGDAAQDHAERRGGFSLAGAGMNDDQALRAALLGHHAVARRLFLRHFCGVPGVLRQFLFGSHASVPVLTFVRCLTRPPFTNVRTKGTLGIFDRRAALDLTFAWMTRDNAEANVKSATSLLLRLDKALI